jgi:hypothetical protein
VKVGRDSALRCPHHLQNVERGRRKPQRYILTTAKMPRNRKQLPHEAPLWVDPSKADYFITICCMPRGKNQLADRTIAPKIFETTIHRNAQGIWYTHLALLMPDHVHFCSHFRKRKSAFKRL